MSWNLNEAVSVIAALISCTSILGGILISMVRKDARIEAKLDRLVDAMESQHSGHPGALSRLSKVESELQQLREWALARGYERRALNRTQE